MEPKLLQRLWECYPKNFGPIEYSTGSANEIVKMNVSFNFRFWTDIGKYGGARPQDIPSYQFPNVENTVNDSIKDASEVKPFGGGVGTGSASEGTTTVQDVTLEA